MRCNRTAKLLRGLVPSVLRAPATVERKRYLASEQPTPCQAGRRKSGYIRNSQRMIIVMLTRPRWLFAINIL